MTEAIGFLGLGQMGSAIAERLEHPDVELHVHDPNVESTAAFVARGAISHPSPKAVADAARIVFACLPTPDICIAAAADACLGRQISTYVEMSTIGRLAIDTLETWLAPAGIALVDAPVSGGPDAARAGTLTVMTAADGNALDRVRPFLTRIAGSLFEVGDTPGLAQSMKLVNNLAAAALIALTTEAMAIGAEAGLDPAIMTAVLDASSGRNSVTSYLLPKYVLNGGYNFGATIAKMTKDVDLAMSQTKAAGLPSPLMAEVARQWHAACVRLGAERDLTRFMDAIGR